MTAIPALAAAGAGGLKIERLKSCTGEVRVARRGRPGVAGGCGRQRLEHG